MFIHVSRGHKADGPSRSILKSDMDSILEAFLEKKHWFLRRFRWFWGHLSFAGQREMWDKASECLFK